MMRGPSRIAALAGLKQLAYARAAEAWDPGSILFGPQLGAYRDRADRRVCICGRRAGKTTLAIVELVDAALNNPGTFSVYIGLTLDAAREDLWRDLIAYLTRHVPDAKSNSTSLAVDFPNGSRIRLRGLDDRKSIEWYRGKKYALVVADECGAQGAWLRELLEDVIGAALMDHGGRILLLGTPGYVEGVGYWWEVCQGRWGYSVHAWTALDNEPLRRLLEKRGTTIEAFLKAEAARLGGEHTSRYLREYLGRWCRDEAASVFPFSPALNVWTTLPGPITEADITFGIDLGAIDATAISVLAHWPKRSPNVYQVAEWVKSKADLPELDIEVIGTRLKAMVAQYRPNRIVCDEGGNKLAPDTLRNRFGLGIVPADKRDRLGQVDFMIADLHRGRLLVEAGSRAAEDFLVVQWDLKARERGVREIAKKPHSDILDALRYAYSAQRAYFYEAPPEVPKDPLEAHRAHVRALLAPADDAVVNETGWF